MNAQQRDVAYGLPGSQFTRPQVEGMAFEASRLVRAVHAVGGGEADVPLGTVRVEVSGPFGLPLPRRVLQKVEASIERFRPIGTLVEVCRG